MPPKEDSKKGRKNIKTDDFPYLLCSPEKKEQDVYKNMNLRDLSPYSPVLRTIKRSYDRANLTLDMAIIETPNDHLVRRNIIDEIDYEGP